MDDKVKHLAEETKLSSLKDTPG